MFVHIPIVPFFAPPLFVAPGDYTAISSQPVTFSSAPDQICIPISISNDGVVEETESFAVTLVTEDPAVLIILQFASVTIIDSSGTYTYWIFVVCNDTMIEQCQHPSTVISSIRSLPQRWWLDSHSLHML